MQAFMITNDANFNGVGTLGRKGGLRKTVKRVGKKAKKGFVKAAPFLAVAAQALNFVVPGLGVAVGLAIGTAGKALEAKETAKQLKAEGKAYEQEEAAAASAENEARGQMTTAYDAAGAYFQKTYGISRDQFIAMPLEHQARFMNIAVYDRQSAAMARAGITRQAFSAMSLNDQASVLSQVAGGAPTAIVDADGDGEPDDLPGAPDARPPSQTQVLAASEMSTTMMIGIGAAAVGVVAIVWFLSRK